MAKHDLSIYLAKQGVGIPELRDALAGGRRYRLLVGERTETLYVFQDRRAAVPAWARLFEGQLPGRDLGQVASISALLPIEVAGRLLVLAFGSGRFRLPGDAFEEQFGFMTVLNIVSPDQIHSIDKQTLDAFGRHTREQTSRSTQVTNFNVDHERDLLRAVVGAPREAALGARATGRDALRVSVDTELEQLPQLLRRYVDAFGERAYLRAFPWLERLQVVNDEGIRGELERRLCERLNARDLEGITLAVPEIVDWDQLHGFRVGAIQERVDYAELDAGTVVEHLLLAVGEITPLDLTSVTIRAIDGNGQPTSRWQLRRCIFAELVRGEHTYVLSGGSWYRVSMDLVAEVDATFARLRRWEPAFPHFDHRDEADYCRAVAAGHNWAAMDRQVIPYGGGRSRVEFCDLFSLEQSAVAHVKRYAGSAPLSHLFQQALVSGQVFRTMPDFRRAVNDRLPADYRLAEPETEIGGFTVILAVIKSGEFGLPFFAKVTLQNVARQLQGFGYEVCLAHIAVDDGRRALRRARPQRNRRDR